VTPVEGDLLDPDTLPDAVRGVSAVVHLAAVLRTSDPAQMTEVNVGGTRNLIDAVRAHPPQARLIMANTGLVYDADLPRPAREDDPTNPSLPYPASKIIAERALRESGLTWSILRFPFLYGDGSPGGGARAAEFLGLASSRRSGVAPPSRHRHRCLARTPRSHG
jgi:nucleoside-diphosphate-sugar epimerase